MSGIRTIPVAATLACCLITAARPAAATCLSADESRQAAASQKLARPGVVQREAMRRARGDPLRSRLCRWNNQLVYEIILLRRDGTVTHVFVSARDGAFIDAPHP